MAIFKKLVKYPITTHEDQSLLAKSSKCPKITAVQKTFMIFLNQKCD